MLIITLNVDAPAGQAIGIKEDLATHLERFGDARIVSITEELPEQMCMGGTRYECGTGGRRDESNQISRGKQKANEARRYGR